MLAPQFEGLLLLCHRHGLKRQPVPRIANVRTERVEPPMSNQLAIVSSMVALEGIFEPAIGDWSITSLCGHCGAET